MRPGEMIRYVFIEISREKSLYQLYKLFRRNRKKQLDFDVDNIVDKIMAELEELD